MLTSEDENGIKVTIDELTRISETMTAIVFFTSKVLIEKNGGKELLTEVENTKIMVDKCIELTKLVR